MNGGRVWNWVVSLEELLCKAFRLVLAGTGWPVAAGSVVLRNGGLDTLLCLGAK